MNLDQLLLIGESQTLEFTQASASLTISAIGNNSPLHIECAPCDFVNEGESHVTAKL